MKQRRRNPLWHLGHVKVQWLGRGMVVEWVWLEVRGGVAVYKGVGVWVWCGWALDGRHCDMVCMRASMARSGCTYMRGGQRMRVSDGTR